MSDTPAISVLLPVYNAETFLREALNSLLAQTFTDFEVVAINDGSTDSSGAILDEYAAKDERLYVVHQSSLKLIATLNKGIGLCRAPLIARFDADDVCLPDRFEKQAAFMTAHPEVVFAGTGLRLIDEKSRPGRKIVRPAADADIRAFMHDTGSCMAHPTVIVRKAALETAEGYHPAFVHAEDYDLWLRLLDMGQAANLPDILLLYRQHSSNVGMRYAAQQAVATLAAQKAARLRQKGLPDPSRQTESLTRDVLEMLGISHQEELSVRREAVRAAALNQTGLGNMNGALDCFSQIEEETPPAILRILKAECVRYRLILDVQQKAVCKIISLVLRHPLLAAKGLKPDIKQSLRLSQTRAKTFLNHFLRR